MGSRADRRRTLEPINTHAREQLKPSAMVSAAMAKAKVLGLIADKDKSKLKRLEEMTTDELRYLMGEIDG